MTQHTNPVPVTAEDRVAAWPFRPSCYKDDRLTREKWNDGVYDDVAPCIQAFARHRLAQSTPVDAPSGEGLHLPWTADPDDRPGYEWNWHVLDAKGDRVCFMANGPDSEAKVRHLVATANTLRTAAAPEPADYGPGDKADCGHWNPIWFAGNPFWNEVMGGPDAKDDPGGVLCLTCFAKRAGDVVIRVSRVSEPAEYHSADCTRNTIGYYEQCGCGPADELDPAGDGETRIINGEIVPVERMPTSLAMGEEMPETADARTPDDVVEALAQFLHDEGGFGDSYPDRTWPAHPDDDGRREGGFVKIVPVHAQEHFRDVARRWCRSKTAALTASGDARERTLLAVLRLPMPDFGPRGEPATEAAARIWKAARYDEARALLDTPPAGDGGGV